MRYKFKTKPYPHQVKALRRAIDQGHIALLWEPGTGKSKAIVDWAHAMHQLGKVDRVLIVAPLSVTGVWRDEFKIHSPGPYKLRRLTKTSHRFRAKEGKLTILVANYDLVWRRPSIIEAFDPQMVVADESHRIKKPSTRRSRYLRTLNDAPFRAILTGTPTPRSFLDIYGQWVFLNPNRFGTRIDEFKNDYIMFGGYMGFTVIGYRNVGRLKRNIARDASIVTEKSARLNLPSTSYQRVPVDLEPQARAAYDEMAWQFFLELQNGEIADAKNAAVKLMRLQQIAGGHVKSDEGNIHTMSHAKMNACGELLEDLFYNGKRVVVFARFIPEVEGIQAIGERLKVPTYVLRGSTKDRDTIRHQFQDNPGPSLFVAQIQTGGLGITLHSSHEVIFYSVTHALDDYIQACKRVHRIGQDHPVTYRHLVAVGTVDTDIYAALRRKQDVMNLIMDDPEVLTRHMNRETINRRITEGGGTTGSNHRRVG